MTTFRTVPDSFTNQTSDPFAIASEYLTGQSGITNFVESQILYAQGIASRAEVLALSTLDTLGAATFQLPDDPIPLPSLDFEFNYDFVLNPIEVSDLGEIRTLPDIDAPVFAGSIDLVAPTIPTFDPTTQTILIPVAPEFNPGAAPGDVPVITDPNFPDAPVLSYPDSPRLENLILPVPPTITIPTFEAEYPTFDFQDIATAIEWTEPEYTPEIMTAVFTQLNTFLAGGTGIRADVEDALFERASEKEDRIAMQSELEATEEFAGRGFVAPPGAMQKRVDAIRADRDLKKQGLNREQVIRAMDVELENLRFATQQGIEAEQLFVQIFLAATDRSFQVAQAVVANSLQLYGLQVQVFQARLEETRIAATVYETQVRAALALIELYKAQIDAEQTKAQINSILVEQYKSELQALESFVKIYEAEVRAESTKMQTQGIRIEAYGEEVKAYAARVGGEKLRFDAYDSQIRGELGKASILESEARAYSAHVSGISAGATAEARVAEAQVGKFRGDIAAYAAETSAQTDRLRIDLGHIQANLAGLEANTRKYSAEAGVQESIGRLELASWDAGNRNQIEFYRTQQAAWEVKLRGLIEEAKLGLQALIASGQLAATINAGALSAMHVGASISGSGGVSASGSLSDSYTTGKSVSQQESSVASESMRQDISYNVSSDASPPVTPPWGQPIGDD